MNAKKWIVGSALVGTLVLGAGAISAQGPGGAGGMGGQGRPGFPGGRGAGGFGEVMVVIEEQTGLDPSEIRLQLQEGSTLADIITENGGDVDTVISEAVTAATERINQAVENERITQEKADEMIAELESIFTEAVNSDTPIREGLQQFRDQLPGGPGQNFGNQMGRGMNRPMLNMGILSIAAEETGLTVEELSAQIQDGATLGDILTENDVDIAAFVDSVISEAETRMNENQANQLTRLRDRLNEQLGISSAEADA